MVRHISFYLYNKRRIDFLLAFVNLLIFNNIRYLFFFSLEISKNFIFKEFFYQRFKFHQYFFIWSANRKFSIFIRSTQNFHKFLKSHILSQRLPIKIHCSFNNFIRCQLLLTLPITNSLRLWVNFWEIIGILRTNNRKDNNQKNYIKGKYSKWIFAFHKKRR